MRIHLLSALARRRCPSRYAHALVLAVLAVWALAGPAQAAGDEAGSRVTLPAAGGPPLRALWRPAAGAGAHPAVVALHGCGGMFNAQGGLSRRFQDYSARLHAEGYSVLLLDSFGSRGVRSICAQRYGQRDVTLAERRGDVLRALEWLRGQPQVDASRLALLGWSNGASTALAVLDAARGPVPPLAGVAVFYPGCAAPEKRQVVLAPVPILMQLGADDDWTPPAPCMALAGRLQARGHDVTLRVYPGSVHGFDGTEPVRVRAEVPNGVDPRGVHWGGNPQARAAALQELDAFLARVLTPGAAP